MTWLNAISAHPLLVAALYVYVCSVFILSASVLQLRAKARRQIRLERDAQSVVLRLLGSVLNAITKENTGLAGDREIVEKIARVHALAKQRYKATIPSITANDDNSAISGPILASIQRR